MKSSYHRIGLLLAAATLAGLLSGCISDTGPQSIGNDQLRYYGGPKEPRWPVTP
ncbi:hypothetical protein [Bradyrhizobium sp. 2TAF24]|uniref:hypothetical protein n=1 Tax=Bradyrhizobium sp. 2TAF24 TaxID=3233011 RepID=UPI003F8F3595